MLCWSVTTHQWITTARCSLKEHVSIYYYLLQPAQLFSEVLFICCPLTRKNGFGHCPCIWIFVHYLYLFISFFYIYIYIYDAYSLNISWYTDVYDKDLEHASRGSKYALTHYLGLYIEFNFFMIIVYLYQKCPILNLYIFTGFLMCGTLIIFIGAWRHRFCIFYILHE